MKYLKTLNEYKKTKLSDDYGDVFGKKTVQHRPKIEYPEITMDKMKRFLSYIVFHSEPFESLEKMYKLLTIYPYVKYKTPFKEEFIKYYNKYGSVFYDKMEENIPENPDDFIPFYNYKLYQLSKTPKHRPKSESKPEPKLEPQHKFKPEPKIPFSMPKISYPLDAESVYRINKIEIDDISESNIFKIKPQPIPFLRIKTYLLINPNNERYIIETSNNINIFDRLTSLFNLNFKFSDKFANVRVNKDGWILRENLR